MCSVCGLNVFRKNRPRVVGKRPVISTTGGSSDPAARDELVFLAATVHLLKKKEDYFDRFWPTIA